MIMSPAMLNMIHAELNRRAFNTSIKEIRTRMINGSSAIVTFDAGWGTYSFCVNRNGRIWQAGMGEAA
jgi:hypothetical protein